jgi:hypothetical protein
VYNTVGSFVLCLSILIIEFFTNSVTNSDPFLCLPYSIAIYYELVTFSIIRFVAFYVHFIFYERKIHQASSTTVDNQKKIVNKNGFLSKHSRGSPEAFRSNPIIIIIYGDDHDDNDNETAAYDDDEDNNNKNRK